MCFAMQFRSARHESAFLLLTLATVILFWSTVLYGANSPKFFMWLWAVDAFAQMALFVVTLRDNNKARWSDPIKGPKI